MNNTMIKGFFRTHITMDLRRHEDGTFMSDITHEKFNTYRSGFIDGQAALADARKDQARYQYVIDWLESNVIATAAFTHARTKSEYDQAIDAAIKEQQ